MNSNRLFGFIYLFFTGFAYFILKKDNPASQHWKIDFTLPIAQPETKSTYKPDPQLSGSIIKMDISKWGDSGLVIKNELLPWLINRKLTDTVDAYWNQIKQDDAIGKYYRTKDSTFYLCFIDHSGFHDWETHIIIELEDSGKILKNERLFHYNYPCWSITGFNKLKNYYTFDVHLTGSSQDCFYFYLFETLKPQKEMTPILKNFWCLFSEFEGLSCEVHSEPILSANSLTMKYEFLYYPDTLDAKAAQKKFNYTLFYSRKNDVWKLLNKQVIDDHWHYGMGWINNGW